MAEDLDEFGIPIRKKKAQEVDEFGIPIRKKKAQEVDEFGIPIKKKISSESLKSGYQTFSIESSFEPKTGKPFDIVNNLPKDQPNVPINKVDIPPITFGNTKSSTTSPNLQNEGGFLSHIEQSLTGEKYSPLAQEKSDKLLEYRDAYKAANPNVDIDKMGAGNNSILKEGKSPEELEGNWAKYWANKTLEGTGQTISGIGDYLMQVLSSAQPRSGSPRDRFQQSSPLTGEQTKFAESELKDYRETIAPKIRGYLKENIGFNVSPELESKYNHNTFVSAIGGLASSLPSIGATIANPGIGVSMMNAQMFDNSMESINSTPEGRDLDEKTKTIFAAGTSFVQTLLEKYGLDKILKSEAGVVSDLVAKKAVQQAIRKSSGEITGDAFTKALNKEVLNLSNKFVIGGSRALDNAITEYATEFGQETTSIIGELLINKSTGKPVFDTNVDSWKGFTKQLSRANQAGVAGLIAGGTLGGISAMAKLKHNEISQSQLMMEQIDHALEDDNVSETTKTTLLEQKIKLQNKIETYESKINSTYNDLPNDKKEAVNDAVESLLELQEAINDPSVSEELKVGLRAEMQSLNAEIGEINGREKSSNHWSDNVESTAEALRSVPSTNTTEAEKKASEPFWEAFRQVPTEFKDWVEDGDNSNAGMLSRAYHDAIKKGNNPELIKAVENLLGKSGTSDTKLSKITYPQNDKIIGEENNTPNIGDQVNLPDGRIGFLKEYLTDGRAIVGLNTDGIYSEETIDLPNNELSSKISGAPSSTASITDKNSSVPNDENESGVGTETGENSTGNSRNSSGSPITNSVWAKAKQKISDLFDFAIKNKKDYDWEVIADVDKEQSKRISEATGLDIKEGYSHIIESNAINHILKEHGDKKIEESRGQIPIVKSDFDRIPEIIDSYDKIYSNKKSSQTNLDVIVYEKLFEDGTTFYLEEVRNGRGKLALKTMYKKKGHSGGLMHTENPPSPFTSETLPDHSLSDTNIQHTTEISKSDIDIEFEGKTPDQLVEMYNSEISNPTQLTAKERAIAEMPFSTNRDSYIQFGDRNNITSSKARSYFKKDAMSLDIIAQEINNHSFNGQEIVTPQDLIDFIDKYPNGPQTTSQPSGNEKLRAINEAYFAKTGKKLNSKIAKNIADKAKNALSNSSLGKISDETAQIIEEENLNLNNIKERENEIRFIYGDDVFEQAIDHLIFEPIFKTNDNGRETAESNKVDRENRSTDSRSSQLESQPESGTIRNGGKDTGGIRSGENTGGKERNSSQSQGNTEELGSRPENHIVEIDGKKTDLSKTSEDDDAQIIAQSFFNPISEAQKLVDKVENKTTEKLVTRITDAVANELKKWRTSKSTIKQLASSYASSIFGGIARNANDINTKLGLIGGKNTAIHNMAKVMKSLYSIVDNNTESLERVHVVLDPDFYQEAIGGQSNAFKPNVPPNLTYDDLTPEEQQLYDEIRKNLDEIHFKNYTLGFISKELFDKHKGVYVPRMYETFELPSEIQEVLDLYQDQVGTKLNLNPFKKRKGLDQLSDQSKDALLKDPVYIMAKRLMELDTNSAIMTFINHINRNNKDLIYSGDTPPHNFIKLNGKAYGSLNGKYVASFVAEDLKGYMFAQKTLNDIYDVFKAYDRTTARKFVKSGLTVFNPFVQLGNFTSNIVFAQMAGIDFVRWFSTFPAAIKSLKTKDADYEALLSAGLIGTDILKSDLMPNTENANSILQEAAAKREAGLKNKLLNPFRKFGDAATKLYGANDDVAKLTAYKIFRKQGYTEAEAKKKIYDGFQNYATVGKFWDVMAKTPVFGNPFMKFPADLMRITGNAVAKKPLSTALYVAALYMIPELFKQIGISDEEDDDKRELRESRPFIPKMDLGVVNIPLVYKTKFGELNLARYVTPYYFFDNGDDGALSSMLDRFNPIKTVKSEGYGKGNEITRPFGQDPVLGTLYNIMMDTDFRGKSIQDPQATRFRATGLTDGQKMENKAINALRTWIPNGALAHDTYLNAKYGEDFYGRTRTMAQSLINFAIKIQDFDEADYKRTAEKQLFSIVNDLKSQSETIKNAMRSAGRKRYKLQENFRDGKLTNSDYQNSLDKLDSELKISVNAGYKNLDELKKKQDEFVKKYGKFLK